MKSISELIKENKFTRLPLASKFSCKFDSFKKTESGNGILMKFNATELTTAKTYKGVLWLANKDVETEEFDKDEVFIIETESELNADGYVVINMVD
jgi:hypothetical protein